MEALIRIYRKLVTSCQMSSKALAASSSAIAKPHASIEVLLFLISVDLFLIAKFPGD